MLRKLRSRLTYANVVATLALFGVLAGGTAYAANTVRSTDIVDGEVKSADVKDQSLTTFDVSTFLGADIVDRSLTAEDLSEINIVRLVINQPALAAHSCAYVEISNLGAQGDHVVMTPDYDDTYSYATYGLEASQSSGFAALKICDVSGGSLAARVTHINLLVIKN